MSSGIPRRSRGFTLIEILIAVAIFGILSVMAFRVLTVILDAKERVDRESRRWRDVGLAVARIEQDVGALIDRPLRDSGGGRIKPICGEPLPRGEAGQIELTRVGALDSPGPIGAPQRVGYRVRDGRLELMYWPVLDRALRTTPQVTPILAEVQTLEFRYMDERGQWNTRWPANGCQEIPSAATVPVPVAPAGIEMVMTLQRGERIRRVFVPAWGTRGS